MAATKKTKKKAAPKKVEEVVQEPQVEMVEVVEEKVEEPEITGPGYYMIQIWKGSVEITKDDPAFIRISK